jgi:hypothetical protein
MLTRSLVLAALAALALAVAPACGGAASSDLFGSVSTDGGGGQGGPGSGGEGGSVFHDASSANESGARDGGLPLADATVVDSPRVDPGISCGSAECRVGADDCCRTAEAAGDSFRCVTRGACVQNNQLAIPCDDAADCATLGMPGTVCCAVALQGTVFQVVCKLPSDCPFTLGDFILCDPDAPDPCPAGGTCSPSGSTTVPYDYCKH